MIQVLLAEDHNIVREGIRMLLESDKGIRIAAEAVSSEQVLEYLSKNEKIDVILVDINMPELDGLSLLKALKALNLDTRVVILSMYDNEKYIFQAFMEGASGYLLKSVSGEELIFALKHIHGGGRYLCSEVSIKMLDKFLQQGRHALTASNDETDFSTREVEVLHLIADGFTNSEISDKLFLSKRTIEGHRQSLIEKTGSRNTAALIRYAVLNGIVQ